MVFEPRFNSTVLADILSIPSSKTLLRRHLNTHFIELIGADNQLIKREAELQTSFQPLSAANKVKLVSCVEKIFFNKIKLFLIKKRLNEVYFHHINEQNQTMEIFYVQLN
jgi:hypothetical protein